jgi:cyclin B
MDRQSYIDEKMRAVLVDWIVQVHANFCYNTPETLFLCVNIVDRYCNSVDVKRDRLQLVGVASFLIACKFEEDLYLPSVADLVVLCDSAYSEEEVLRMEFAVLQALQYRLRFSTSYTFFDRMTSMLGANLVQKFIALFYLELVLLEHDLLKYHPSVICASAIILAMNTTNGVFSEVNYNLIVCLLIIHLFIFFPCGSLLFSLYFQSASG